MTGERLRIVQALHELDSAASIDRIAAEAGLSRGKVLGNLSRLCMDGLVNKREKFYSVTEKGRAILREAEPVPDDKAFYFYFGENKPTKHVARSLREFYDTVKTIDLGSLTFHMQRGDFEKWIRDVLEDKELAAEVAKLRLAGLSGDDLRSKLCESISSNYKIVSAFIA